MPQQAKKSARKPREKRIDEFAFVVSREGAVFEHLADDLDEEDSYESDDIVEAEQD